MDLSPKTRRRAAKLAMGTASLVIIIIAGCVRVSNNEWYIRSAAMPEGWPAITPVGEIEVKEYPVYREAFVQEVDLDLPEGRNKTRPMFMSLFRHISSNDIPMTAPVDMGFRETDDGGLRMNRMSFLYGETGWGATGLDGAVQIRDTTPATFVSIGVRGGYSKGNYRSGLTRLDAWLGAQNAWRQDGSPRFLGYNSPFVPWFLKYGEVQVPVVSAGG